MTLKPTHMLACAALTLASPALDAQVRIEPQPYEQPRSTDIVLGGNVFYRSCR